MTTRHGFELQSEQNIRELDTKARLFLHRDTGAELLSLSNKDENKVFGITFRTPSSDSTGVAHILEHSVLCGSRKYPVKEPFVELLKGSLKTFLNAFTYPDKTSYPVASQNLKDFYNLIDVYLDAVFFPRLSPFTFKQEGWHFELEEVKDPFVYKGVVFNEMKGAYSSSDNLLTQYSMQSLFPDSPYGFDSGGNPKHIPDLSFEQFQAFHKAYYHPSNSRIYFYGDDDPDERLRFINAYLMEFGQLKMDSTVPLQLPFAEPKRLVRHFMADAQGGSRAKGMVTLNWLLPETTETHTNFALHLLEYMLIGMPASPLRKELIDSRLGEDIAGEGLGAELRQMYFSTGMKGTEQGNLDKIEGLVIETLDSLARKGLDPLTIEAALNTVEFRLRENNTGNFPRGLVLMLRSLTTWLYGGDPFALLAFEAPLEEIKARAKSDTSYFEGMINRFFVNNLHRTTLTLKPDPELHKRDEAAEKARLEKARSAMSREQLHATIDDTRTLKRIQETPDSREALATIPSLKLEDLDKKNKKLPLSFFEHQDTKILFHDLVTNGIAYLDLGFDLRPLSGRYLPYVPLFGRALLEMGTEKEDFVALTQRINRKTGGIVPHTFCSSVRQMQGNAVWLFLRGKVMAAKAPELIEILRDLLLTVRLDNQERFKQIVLQEKARAEQALIPGGHAIVNLRLRAHFDEAHWAAEQMGGISYLFFLRKLADDVEQKWPEVFSALEEIRGILINRKTMVFNATIDQEGWPGFQSHVNGLLDSLPEATASLPAWSCDAPAPFEGMTIPSQVNYVGKGANLYELGYRFHGSSLVITRYLRNAWLWDRIRIRGGAYGAFCLFDRLSGILTYVSYRDPNILETLDAFDQSARFLQDTDLSTQELTKSITGAIGDMDSHMLPDAKAYVSMIRHLTDDTEQARQEMRDQVLGTNQNDFRSFAEILGKVGKRGLVKVLGPPDSIKATNRTCPGWLDEVKVL